jgi:hypothetical protein
MAYDSAIISFTTKTNKVDLVDASHINAVQAELVIIETILGAGLKGTVANLSTRLNNMLDPDGSVLSGTSYPSPALYPSQLFYKTDVNTLYIRNAANTSWAPVSAVSNVQIFTTPGSNTFVAPTGITQVYLSMIGGGGGGGSSNGSAGAGGGGSGAYILNRPYTVIAGNSYTVTIGAAGVSAHNNADTDGTDGGSTSFDTLTVAGGGGGKKQSSGGAGGAAATGGFTPGTPTAGGYTFPGTAGATRSTNTGGGGAGSPFGIGGAGDTSGNSGHSAAANTGAGGGGAGTNGGAGGGDGGSGVCVVAY